LIDSHCHLFFDSLKNNFPRIIERAINNNITSILSINTKMKDFESHYKLINDYKSVYISCGQHPEHVTNEDIISAEDIIFTCNNNEKVIGIGETGVDLFHTTDNIKSQCKSFENHIEASIETKLPLIIHQRDSENKIIDILSNYKNYSLPLVMHCFTGSEKFRNFCIEANYYISLSGIVTFNSAKDLRDVIKDIPLNLLLIETDAPFLSPVPMRGKNNEPSFVRYTGEFLSKLFDISFVEFEKITDNNFYKLFSKAIHYKEIST
jgi:TatD DNase family protein